MTTSNNARLVRVLGLRGAGVAVKVEIHGVKVPGPGIHYNESQSLYVVLETPPPAIPRAVGLNRILAV
jgi:hypothetical protein